MTGHGDAAYGDFVRARRAILGLSQRELAERAQVKQPTIAAIETGRREASAATRTALDRALDLRPSVALKARREAVLEVLAAAGVARPRVFGSVARGDDVESSDLDIMAEFGRDHDVMDLLELEDELSTLLTVRTEIVDARGAGAVLDHARAESEPL
ncbi:MAG TPA: helix-turn-helix domain-containing protein [Microbacterium sp.]|nr:helix-turn-helix domain-containing protein [Microbacterium sp.]